MSAENDFRATLMAHAPLVALTGTRVAQNVVRQGASLPLVAYAARHEPVLNLLGETTDDQCSFTVQCWSQTALEADAVADAVTAAVADADPVHGAVVIAREGDYDPEMDVHATVLTVEWWA